MFLETEATLPYCNHSRASHSHTVCVISSAIKHCTLFLPCLGPVRKRVHAIIQPHTPQAWFGRCFCWKLLKQHLFVCWSTAMKLYTFGQCVALPLGRYSTKWCQSLKKMYSLYSLWIFPHSLIDASEAPIRTRKGCMQSITSHDKKDHDSKINDCNWSIKIATIIGFGSTSF